MSLASSNYTHDEVDVPYQITNELLTAIPNPKKGMKRYSKFGRCKTSMDKPGVEGSENYQTNSNSNSNKNQITENNKNQSNEVNKAELEYNHIKKLDLTNITKEVTNEFQSIVKNPKKAKK